MRQASPKSLKVLFLLVTIGGACTAAAVYAYQVWQFTTRDVELHASDPLDWRVEDESISLAGRYYFPRGFSTEGDAEGSSSSEPVYPAVVLFHGLRGKLEDNDYLARELVTRGVVVLCVSFRGHGESGGEFPFDDPSRYNATFGDANGAYRALHGLAHVDPSRIGAMGQSLGGGAALFLALEGLLDGFVLWYPGTAYILGTTPLYNHTLGDTISCEGYIIQGTEDECSRCSPEFTRWFVEHNPGVEVYWIDGGGHGAGDDFLTYVSRTTDWFSTFWELNQTPPSLNAFLSWGYAPLLPLGAAAVADTVLLILINRARGRRPEPVKTVDAPGGRDRGGGAS
ncbi:MAG: alpha/beta hydrolase [Promethearchaeota archaeon]